MTLEPDTTLLPNEGFSCYRAATNQAGRDRRCGTITLPGVV